MTDKSKALPEPPSWWEVSEPRSIRVAPATQEVADRFASGGRHAFEDRFPLVERIAEGGMGEIHIARDRDLRRLVAVKVMRPRLRDDHKALSRFVREAQITAQLSHPAVVPLHSLDGSAEGDPALVMKWIEGWTFDDYVDRCWEATVEDPFQEEEYGCRCPSRPLPQGM